MVAPLQTACIVIVTSIVSPATAVKPAVRREQLKSPLETKKDRGLISRGLA